MLTLHLTEDEVATLKWALQRSTRRDAANYHALGAEGARLAQDQEDNIRRVRQLRQRVVNYESVPNFAAHIDIE